MANYGRLSSMAYKAFRQGVTSAKRKMQGGGGSKSGHFKFKPIYLLPLVLAAVFIIKPAREYVMHFFKKGGK